MSRKRQRENDEKGSSTKQKTVVAEKTAQQILMENLFGVFMPTTPSFPWDPDEGPEKEFYMTPQQINFARLIPAYNSAERYLNNVDGKLDFNVLLELGWQREDHVLFETRHTANTFSFGVFVLMIAEDNLELKYWRCLQNN